MKILIKNRQKHRSLNKSKITRITRKILSLLEKPMAELSIMFVGDKKMSELNAVYRGINRSTDVLSFPQTSQKSSRFPLPAYCLLLGDVVISIPRAELQAKTYGWSFYDEISRLLIHGALHLLGYDHEKSVYKARTMRKKEQEIFNAVKEMD